MSTSGTAPPPTERAPQSDMDNRLQCSPGNSTIEQLPDEVLILILSFLTTIAEVARTSCLSRRWRNLWHNITCLDFAPTFFPEPWEWLVKNQHNHAWYITWVNKVIEARVAIPQLPFVKQFRIRWTLSKTQGQQHIDRWIDYAIANQVENLHLELSGYVSLVHPDDLYNICEESWYKAPSGLSSLKFLKSIFLSCVNVSKQFIEFILASCPLLEGLSLHLCGTVEDLDVSGVPPLRLRRLKINTDRITIAKLCAPYLTSLLLQMNNFSPQKIDVPMINDLIIDSSSGGFSKPIVEYLEHFWSYLPQLEKLELKMSEPQEFRFIPMPQLVKLKYLKLCADWDTDLVFYRIINFVNACPLLETFALQIYDEDMIPSPLLTKRDVRNQKRRVERNISNSFKCLKALELYGGDGKTLDQEIVKCIIRKAPNLEKLMVSLSASRRYPMLFPSKPDITKVVEAKAKELCQERTSEIKITVVGCCGGDTEF